MQTDWYATERCTIHAGRPRTKVGSRIASDNLEQNEVTDGTRRRNVMTSGTNPIVRVKVNVVELDGRERLVARTTFASGSEGDIPIDSQDDLWQAVADHKYERDHVVFGEGAFDLFLQLPESR